MTENKVNKVSDKFFDILDDVRMIEGDLFKVIEMVEDKMGRMLSGIEMMWCEEMVGFDEEEG